MSRALAIITLGAAVCLAAGCSSESDPPKQTKPSGPIMQGPADGDGPADTSPGNTGNGGQGRPKRPIGGGTPL